MSKINILDELQQNFLDSSWETNCNRAFPDVRDGLKPGQRACLWEMYIKKYTSNKPHVKSAKVSGGVIADLWPHGDTAIYETFARMSQPFTNNLPEVDWHGANGNVILGGDALAHQRYTECRLAPITEEGMLKNINKQVVDMIPNFSEDLEWPKVFPAIFPRLLVNGAQGIGVGQANYWLPHNFSETVNLIVNYVENNVLDEDNYFPDFPTGGTIINPSDLSHINKYGKGKVLVEAKYKIQNNTIIFYEFPYQVFIEPLIDEIKKAIDENKISGIKDVSNRSDKKHLALVVECEDEPEKVLEYLFAETNLRKQYNANQNGLLGKTPRMFNLQQYVDAYLDHNLTCIYREFEFEYKKTCERLHILEGLIWAVRNIDTVIQIVREKDYPESYLMRMNPDWMTGTQVKAILDMKLGRLSKLEENKLVQEQVEKEKYAAECQEIIENENRRKEILIERLKELEGRFRSERKTNINEKQIIKTTTRKSSSGKKILIPEDVFVSMTGTGYIKSVPVKMYRQSAADVTVFKTQTTDLILLFSSLGKVFRLKVDSIKQCGSKDKGVAIGSLLNLESGEKILNIFSMNTDVRHPYIVGFTKNGLVKKSEKTIYVGATQNKNGLKAATLVDNDEYIGWYECNGDCAVVLSHNGFCIKFDMQMVNAVGKTARGVKSISLGEGDYVAAATVVSPQVDSFKLLSYNLKNKDIPLVKRAGKGKKIV